MCADYEIVVLCGQPYHDGLETAVLHQMATFIHRITSGIAGWLTFEQMRNSTANLREAELAKPIEDIAQGRGFEVKGEFPLPKPKGKHGRPACIDFLLVHRGTKLVVTIEIKYKKTGKKMAGGISNDAARLHNLNLEAINAQIRTANAGSIKHSVTGYKLERAVLVVWKQSSIMEQMEFEHDFIVGQFEKLVSAMLPDGVAQTWGNFRKTMLGQIATKPIARSYGSLRAGSTVTHKRFWVASFLYQKEWGKQQSLAGK